MKARDFSDLFSRLDSLPDVSVVPIPAVAIIDTVSESTVKRYYPVVRISERISGVPLGYLRRRSEAFKPTT
jgi:hypothetical protein